MSTRDNQSWMSNNKVRAAGVGLFLAVGVIVGVAVYKGYIPWVSQKHPVGPGPNDWLG